MKRNLLIASSLLFLALAACSKKIDTAALKKAKEEACACKDKACADKAMKTLKAVVGDAKESSVTAEQKSLATEGIMCAASAGASLD